MNPPEFSRPIDRRRLPSGPVGLAANAQENAAVAERFGLVRVDKLEASLLLEEQGEAIFARGRLNAEIVQSCAISAEDLPVTIDEPLELRFVPERPIDAEELELHSDELDEITFDGDALDLGEAVAQSLALAIDPYAVGPEAERVRQEAGLLDEAASGPFAALAALKKD
jgi:uncharacterized metal-binding protein YceD (DUF177 family)